MKRIALHHMAFVGPESTVEVRFGPGLNIIYGASNTGKSYVLRALNFMLGGSDPLPRIEQSKPYDGALLGIVMPDAGPTTLYRSMSGGAFLEFPGLHFKRPPVESGRVLHEQHDSKNADNVSRFLLSAIGLDQKQLVKNVHGEKRALSFRNLVPYLLVDETSIIKPESAFLSGQYADATFEKNILKVLLTGFDDSSVVPQGKPATLKAVLQGKVEMLDEMIAAIDTELEQQFSDRDAILENLKRIEREGASLERDLRALQDQIDSLVAERRRRRDARAEAEARLAELELTLERFSKLDDVYTSDLARLEAMEEGGALLVARLGRQCPVCGADPESQRHSHGAEDIRRTHRAAEAEARRIERDRAALALTVESLRAEAKGLLKHIQGFDERLAAIEGMLGERRPRESQLRRYHEELQRSTSRARKLVQLLERRESLSLRRAQLLERKAGRTGRPSKPLVGIDGATAHDFANAVEDVLRAWDFPGRPRVTFDPELQDIRVDGKPRSANGKGVRALLHAAVKVAVLEHCLRRGLPHPGFLVLDTPLLTYREPLKEPRYGDLDDDEKTIKASALNVGFYRHLASFRGAAQFIVLENRDPPLDTLGDSNVTVYTGERDSGRFGLFPA